MPIPKLMRAVLLNGQGGPEMLEYRENVTVPRPETGEVLIEVGACGINNTDIWSREAGYAEKQDADDVSRFGDQPPLFPRIQGADIAGRIVETGTGADETRLGTRVMVDFGIYQDHDQDAASVDYIGYGRDGGFAEYVVVPAENAHSVDSDLTDAELATFCCAYITAERMLNRARVTAGEQVLITGASGGVGSATVQLCRARGAIPLAVVSAGKEQALRDIGAEAAVTRGAGDFKSTVVQIQQGPLDVVVDTVGGSMFSDLLDLLRSGGRYVSCGAIGGPVVELDLRTMYLKHLDLIGSSQGSRREFKSIVDYVVGGKIKPLLAATYPLSDIARAQSDFLKKDFIGKLVIDIKS
jgi:alcohol dehydrogenase